VDIVVNRLGSLHATIPVEMAGRADGKKSQLMMHSIGFISAKAVTLLLVGSSRGWKNFMAKKKGSESGIGSFVRNSSLISLYSLHVYIHFCLWSRNHDALTSSDFVTLSRYADKKDFFPTAVAV
jgi:hypothetical protein